MANERTPYTGRGELSDAQRQFLLSMLGGTVPPGAEAAASQLQTAALAERAPGGAWRLTREGSILAQRLRDGL